MTKAAILTAISIVCFPQISSAADRLAADSFKTNRSYSCGFIGGAWEPGQLKRDGLFYSVKAEIDQTRTALSQATNRSSARRLTRKLADLINRRNRANIKFCSGLATPSSVLVDSFSDLPNPSEILGAESGADALGGNAAFSVSGTPPGLSSIRSTGIKNIFWNSGTVDALASNTQSLSQCADFLRQTSDGQSGGFNACYMAQNLGEAFDPILGASTNSCYMRHIATQANIDAGLVRLTRGSLLGGDISRSFATPNGNTRRIVRMNVANAPVGQVRAGDTPHALIYITASETNTTRGDSYAYDFVMCDSDADIINEMEKVRIGTDNSYSAEVTSGVTEVFLGRIRTSLRSGADGSAGFDPTAVKLLEVAYSKTSDGSATKADITITPDNVLLLKNFLVFPSEISKFYQVGSFSGDSALSLGVREGASQRSFSQDGGATFNTEISSIEYRSTNYVYAPANPYRPWLSAVDFSTDPFYLTAPSSISRDFTGYSCADRGEIELEVDFSHPLMTPILAACEGNRLREMNFCNADSTVNTAYTNYTMSCPI